MRMSADSMTESAEGLSWCGGSVGVSDFSIFLFQRDVDSVVLSHRGSAWPVLVCCLVSFSWVCK